MIYNRNDRPHDEDDNELWDDDLSIDGRADDSDGYAEPEEYAGAGEDIEDKTDEVFDDEADPDSEDEADEMPDDVEEDSGRVKRKTGGFFGLGRDDEDDENDFYDSDVEPQKPVVVKQPKLDPEDPDYWIEEESEISRIIPKPRKAWKWWLAAAAGSIALLAGVWVWFMRPYADGAVKYGYIKHMERRGSVVKTFEGVLIPYRELGDSTPTYFEEIRFSVEGDSLAAQMKRMMLGCVPVRLEYKRYHSALPWKGEEPMVVVKADTADTSRILPPEYR